MPEKDKLAAEELERMEESRDFHRNASSTRFALLRDRNSRIEKALATITDSQRGRISPDSTMQVIERILKGEA